MILVVAVLTISHFLSNYNPISLSIVVFVTKCCLWNISHERTVRMNTVRIMRKTYDNFVDPPNEFRDLQESLKNKFIRRY